MKVYCNRCPRRRRIPAAPNRRILGEDTMAGIFRDNLLAGRTAFLTGGSSGIGLRIAERFAAHGARVALMGRTQEKLDAACRGIEATGGAAMGCAGDVRDYAAVDAALARTFASWGPIDILVCGAAGNFPAPVTGMSSNGFRAVMEIDLLGTFHACRAAFERLRKPGACVLSISATFSLSPAALQAHVAAAKAGVDVFSKTLALEWAASGVRVNVIAPGPIDDTEGMRRLAPGEEHRRRAMQAVPLGRFGTRDEVADLALFLCSEAAGFITGAVYVCDGGQSVAGSSALLSALDIGGAAR
jgi:NAD(P)-dependent dehydrogenase (short-subunit alcohol dehydrogenase family)